LSGPLREWRNRAILHHRGESSEALMRAAAQSVLQGGMEDRLASHDMDHEAKAELISIFDGLSPEGRAAIASLREDQVIKLHFGLGLYIRNQIRQGRLQALFRWSRTQVPEHVKNLDDVTFPILVEVWRLVIDTPAPR
jgi:hypothetical protein